MAPEVPCRSPWPPGIRSPLECGIGGAGDAIGGLVMHPELFSHTCWFMYNWCVSFPRRQSFSILPDGAGTRQQLIAAQAAIEALRDFECSEDSAGGAAYARACAADTCIEALIATIAVLGDVSFGDIRNISFLGEGQGLGEPDRFDSPACSEHSSRSSRRSSRHSSDDVEMGSDS